MAQTNQAPFQSIKDAAISTGLSQKHLRALCAAGKAPYTTVGIKYMINVPALLELLDAESRGVVRAG